MDRFPRRHHLEGLVEQGGCKWRYWSGVGVPFWLVLGLRRRLAWVLK